MIMNKAAVAVRFGGGLMAVALSVVAAQSDPKSEANVPGVAATPSSPDEAERLAQERSYQQALAKRRADEAKARAKIESAAAAEKDAATRYHKLIEAANHYAASADFQAGIRTFNLAMQAKPADEPVSDQVRQLQVSLQAQNTPVEITLLSDGLTTVSVTGPYGHRAPAPLHTATVKVLPANYDVTGRRKGFQDVVIPVAVRNGVPAPVISVTCTVPAQ
jgi:hypothetical protein